ncbi:MAG TPA: helix-turn-helix transcriptional regulator [Bacteroidales bacterium]|nr:helix-turn-helix transcriptional regulator [Bacteroidales bacterium]
MVLILATIGIFLSVILLYHHARRFTSAVYLSLFFLGVSLYMFYQYVLVTSKSVVVVSYSLLLIPIFGSIIYLTGPLLYWYVRSVLSDRTVFKKSDLWHLLPMVIFFLAALPELFSSWSDKFEAATAIVHDAKAMEFYKPTLLSRIFSYPFMFISRPVLILGYTCWSIIIFTRYFTRRKELSILPGQTFMIRWLLVLLASMFFLLVSHTLLAIEFTMAGSNLFFALNALKVLSLINLIILLLSPFFFPHVLYGLPQIPVQNSNKNELTANNKIYEKDQPKNSSAFETEYLLTIQKAADKCMEEFQPYLQSDCNLASLAKLTKIPAHHYSVFFRELKKQSFNDYRNEWRVKHAKKLILEGKSSDLSMEGIGLLSGFSSRNTFYNAFKKVEGISPGAFAAQIGY